MGHNTKETDEDRLRKQQFFKLFGQKKKYESSRASADSEIKGVYQRAQAAGLTKKHFAFAKKFDDVETEEEFMEDLRIMMEVAQWMGARPARQMSLNLVDRTPQTEVAYSAGYRVGAIGGAMQNTYDPGSAEGQEWLRGFHDGNALRVADDRAKRTAEELAEADGGGDDEDGDSDEKPAAVATGKKRGRPPKAKPVDEAPVTQSVASGADAEWDAAAPQVLQ